MILDQDFLEEIQYALVEPPNGGQSWPSGLWTAEEVRQAATQRQDRFLKQTHALTTLGVVASPAGDVRLDLPSAWMTTVEAVWYDLAQPTPGTELQRSDTFEADHAIPAWPLTFTQPEVYMDVDSPTLVLQIAPPPGSDGTISLRYVAQSAPLTGNGTALTLPDVFAPCLKYGTLADLLGKRGRGQDVQRAAYAEDAYQLGIDLTRVLLEGQS